MGTIAELVTEYGSINKPALHRGLKLRRENGSLAVFARNPQNVILPTVAHIASRHKQEIG